MDISMPDLTKCSNDSDYGSRDTTFSESDDVKIRGVCMWESNDKRSYRADLSRIVFTETSLYVFRDSVLCLLYTFEEPIFYAVFVQKNDLVVVTARGMHSLDTSLTTLAKMDGSVLPFSCWQNTFGATSPTEKLLTGSFEGLDVLGSRSISPIVVTTRKSGGFMALCLIDWKEKQVIREVALSVIPSDMTPFSEISWLSADESNQEVIIVDRACQFVIKVDLESNSCSLFGWQTKVPVMMTKMMCVHLGDAVVVICVHTEGSFVFQHSRQGDLRRTIKLDYPLDYIGVLKNADKILKTTMYTGDSDGILTNLNIS